MRQYPFTWAQPGREPHLHKIKEWEEINQHGVFQKWIGFGKVCVGQHSCSWWQSGSSRLVNWLLKIMLDAEEAPSLRYLLVASPEKADSCHFIELPPEVLKKLKKINWKTAFDQSYYNWFMNLPVYWKIKTIFRRELWKPPWCTAASSLVTNTA